MVLHLGIVAKPSEMKLNNQQEGLYKVLQFLYSKENSQLSEKTTPEWKKNFGSYTFDRKLGSRISKELKN